jgi:L-alanine-DL-glutamate epimerase-like enolase superfamily enzyme
VIDPIASIDVGTTRLRLPARLRIGPVEIESREYAAVRVTTEAGLTGVAYCLTREAPVEQCVRRLVAPALVGTDGADPDEAWRRASRATVFVGRTGLVLRAVGLVDIALWDVAAQRAGQPLWQLLGGTAQDVPLMIVSAYPLADRTPESLADDVLAHASEGYRLLKVARDHDTERMRRLLRRATAGLPDGARLVVDAGFGWEDAAGAAAEVARWDVPALAWLEDPLVPEDVEGYADLHARVSHPIGVGDELGSAGVFRALLDAGAADVVRIDAVAIGGITPARSISALARQHGAEVSYHIYPEASVHLAAADGGVVETFDRSVAGGNPLDPAERLVSGGPVLAGGVARPPASPGLGFDLDWELFGGVGEGC